MPQCGLVRIPRVGKKRRRTFSTFSFGEELFGRCGGKGIPKILIQNAFQVGASSAFEMKFVLLQKAQTGANYFRLVIKTAGRDKTLNHLLKMRSYHFAHRGSVQQFQTVVNDLPSI